jgi:hypothetical protein
VYKEAGVHLALIVASSFNAPASACASGSATNWIGTALTIDDQCCSPCTLSRTIDCEAPGLRWAEMGEGSGHSARVRHGYMTARIPSEDNHERVAELFSIIRPIYDKL